MYNFVLSIVRGIYRLLFKIEIEGLEKIPKDKNFLVVPNHLSNFDPPLVAAFLPIKMTYMAKASLFKVPVVAQVIKAFGAFPVKRSGHDISAVKTAIKLLKDGNTLVIFPEGVRVRTPGTLGKGKQGDAQGRHHPRFGYDDDFRVRTFDQLRNARSFICGSEGDRP